VASSTRPRSSPATSGTPSRAPSARSATSAQVSAAPRSTPERPSSAASSTRSRARAGAIVDAITGLIPGPLRKVAKNIPGIGGLFKRRGGRVGPTAGGPRLFIAGEGAADEWVISQEGNRGENVRWAREALESLTGRRVELHRGGKGAKHKPKRKPLKPILTGGQVNSAVTGQERGLANFDRDLSRLERVYGQLDREAGLSQEEFIVEHDDGTTTIDKDAIAKRVTELDTQITFLRNQIGDKLRAYRKAVQAALGVYNTVIDAPHARDRPREGRAPRQRARRLRHQARRVRRPARRARRQVRQPRPRPRGQPPRH
jgi:hypothetical protein